MRGPLVYCLEETDNGENLSSLYVDTKEALTENMGGTGVRRCDDGRSKRKTHLGRSLDGRRVIQRTAAGVKRM